MLRHSLHIIHLYLCAYAATILIWFQCIQSYISALIVDAMGQFTSKHSLSAPAVPRSLFTRCPPFLHLHARCPPFLYLPARCSPFLHLPARCSPFLHLPARCSPFLFALWLTDRSSDITLPIRVRPAAGFLCRFLFVLGLTVLSSFDCLLNSFYCLFYLCIHFYNILICFALTFVGPFITSVSTCLLYLCTSHASNTLTVHSLLVVTVPDANKLVYQLAQVSAYIHTYF